ncbi:MAG: hypothetical protein PHO83_06680 [Geobacteraceae bacterium]|nr:hypothetical protein [Geobacteraceae bacterium]
MILKNWTQLISIILVTIMFAIAEAVGEMEIIFPEIAALAFGFWIMEKSPWQGTKLTICASPTLAALTGVILLRYAPFSPLLLIGSAFLLVILQLKLLRSAVLPSLSASILPIITHTTSWLYPLSVAILTAIIALGRLSLEALDHKETSANFFHQSDRATANEMNFLPELLYWSKILAGVLLVTALALQSRYLFMIAPPLMVGFVEISRPNRPLRRTPGKILLLLFLAAAAGVLWFYLVTTILHGSLWIFSFLTITSVFLLYEALQVSFPPAVAIALLPVLVPPANLWHYPLHVLLGSTLFILMGIFCFRDTPAAACNES